MVGSQEEWRRYDRWNTAIAGVVYSQEMAGQPTYLDLEDDVLSKICEVAEPGITDPVRALVEVVKGTLLLGSPAALLEGHLRRLDTWHEGTMLDPPPTLGLLALLSVVAESMRRSADMRAHNFYGRLAQLANMSDEELRHFEHAYRRHRDGVPASCELWESLNDWLEMCEGGRGLPTAVPLGHEHIGYPLSQALVRQADRDKFIDLFTAQGLAAGITLSGTEMEVEIDEWLSRVPCPASNALERLWKEQPEARRLICDVAVITLEEWDGSGLSGADQLSGQRTIDNIRLRATLHRFPRKRLSLSIAVAGTANHDAERVDVLGPDDVPVSTIELVPSASGWLGLDDATELDATTFLMSEVHLRRPGVQGLLTRRPRRVVTLRRDDLLMGFVESDRVQLGGDSAVLCRSEESDRVEQFLGRVARPGFQLHTVLDGLPPGWVLFEGVQIVSVPPKDPNLRLDLYRLLPATRAQSGLHGGLKLPGNLPKWLTVKPPELRVSVPDASMIEARLTCRRPLTCPAPDDRSRIQRGAVLIWDLAEEHLPDGDYRLTISADGKVVSSEVLRLRSADNPAARTDDGRGPISHDPVTTGFALKAAPSKSAMAFRGVPDIPRTLPASRAPTVPRWWEARQLVPHTEAALQSVSFPQSTPPCMESGAHLMNVESWMTGMRSYKGVCAHCGLVKRYPATWQGVVAKRRKRTGAPAERIVELPDVRSLPPLPVDSQLDWESGFDAVCHIGSGPASALERIAAQLDAGSLFADVFLRRLEALAHVEIERSPVTLLPIRWQVNDPMLLGLPSGQLVVTGFRSEHLFAAIDDAVYSLGGELKVKKSGGAPPIIKIIGVDNEGAARILEVIDEATRLERGIGPARHIPDAADRLAAILPPLSKSRAGLPVTTALAASSFELWDPVIARFRPTPDMTGPGAFRTNGHGRHYVYRQTEDLGTLEATLGDARIVKYLAAADVGSSLIGFDNDAEVLYAPLGAELPGLYGRAAVLASGKPPEEDLDQNLLAYRQVPGALAAHLNHLLMS